MNSQFQSGVSSELFVAHFFVERGYSVLWPLLTQSRYDIVIEKDGIFHKLQVKKATWSKSGNHKYLQARITGRDKFTNTPYKKEDVDFFVFTDNSTVWLASYAEIGHLTSVCLLSTNPEYKPQTKYKSEAWVVK